MCDYSHVRDVDDLQPCRSSPFRRMTVAERDAAREDWRPPRGKVWTDEALHPALHMRDLEAYELFVGPELLPGKREMKRRELRWWLGQGYSIREAARRAGTSRNTARAEHRRLLAAGVDPRCRCGKPATHQGWCRERFAESPVRQTVMRRMNGQPSDAWQD